MYVTVSPSGTVTFRYDYRFNGRRETLTLGRYGPDGISLAMALSRRSPRDCAPHAIEVFQARLSALCEKCVHNVRNGFFKTEWRVRPS